MFWHAGLPLAVIAYALCKNETSGDVMPRESIRDAVVFSVIAMIGAACGLTLLATAGQASLPALMRDSGYTLIMTLVSATVWILSLMALMVLWVRRPYSMLDLWLMVAMYAWQFDVALSSVLNAERFDLGFYTGRIYGLLAAGIFLLVLLLETGAAYARLARSNTTERRAREQQLHELGDVFAWLVSLAEQLGCSLEDAIARYQQGCPRCGALPCACASSS